MTKNKLPFLILIIMLLTLTGCTEPEVAAAPATATTAATATAAPAASVEPSPSAALAEVELLGESYSADAEHVEISDFHPKDTAAVVEALRSFTALKSIKLGYQGEYDLSLNILKSIHEACPEAVIDYEYTLYDRVINLSDEALDLRDIPISDNGALVRQVAALMVRLNYLDMDGCGVSNADMAAIREQLPQAKVVWRVTFGDHYSVRTDTERILASLPGKGGELVNANTNNLKYCIYTKYIDLGHNNYLDTIDFIRYMPDLEVGIFAMCNVEDFSPLADCPKLEYLELETSRLHDLTPLSGLTNLRHLNICYNFSVTDISPLYSLTELERLWIGCYDPVPPEQIEKMQEMAPNCVINVTTPDPTEEGWRMEGADGMGNAKYQERYALLREQFGYQEGDYSLDYYWRPYYDYY